MARDRAQQQKQFHEGQPKPAEEQAEGTHVEDGAWHEAPDQQSTFKDVGEEETQPGQKEVVAGTVEHEQLLKSFHNATSYAPNVNVVVPEPEPEEPPPEPPPINETDPPPEDQTTQWGEEEQR